MNHLKKKVAAGLLAVGCAAGGTVAMSTSASAAPAAEQHSVLPGQQTDASHSLATATVYSPTLEPTKYWHDVETFLVGYATGKVLDAVGEAVLEASSSSSSSDSSSSSSGGPAASHASLHGSVPMDAQFNAKN